MRKIVPVTPTREGHIVTAHPVHMVYDTSADGALFEVSFYKNLEGTPTLRHAHHGQVYALVLTEPEDQMVALKESVDWLVDTCHRLMAHWWIDPHTGANIRENPFTFPTKAMLIVTEISEAIDGDRSDKMDDKLPQYPMREVELADALIRIGDLAGAYEMRRLGQIVAEKMAVNLTRADHKMENRVKVGGKKY